MSDGDNWCLIKFYNLFVPLIIYLWTANGQPFCDLRSQRPHQMAKPRTNNHMF